MELFDLPESRSESRDYKGHAICVRANRANTTVHWTILVDIQRLGTGAWLPSLRDDSLSFADLGQAFDEGARLGRNYIDLHLHLAFA